MSRVGRSAPDESGGWADGDEAVAGREGRRPAAASAWLGGGLTLAALAALAALMVQVIRDEHETAQAQFHRTESALGSVAFAPDGRSLALGRADGGVVIEDLADGRARVIEGGPGMGVLARGLAYSPDGRVLASGGLGPGVKLWDAESGSLLASLEGHDRPAAALAFSPDGRTLASGSLDGSIKLWDVESRRERAAIVGHEQAVRGLAFSPDGRTLASGSLEGSVKLWDVESRRERAAIGAGQRRVFALAFSPDGRALALALSAAAGEPNGRVVLWSPGEHRQPFRLLGLACVSALAFSPDGRTLAGGGGDRVLKLWDLATGRETASLAGHEGFIASLAFSPDGRTVATAGQDTYVGLFNLDRGRARPPGHRL